MATRRMVLVTGAAAIPVVIGLGGCSGGGDLKTARAPWAEAGGFADPRLNALSYAVLAPSPHNRQPWLAALDGDSDVVIYPDRDRLLPMTDPQNRQIVIGLGAFLEVFRQAAAEAGYDVAQTLFPDGVDEAQLDDRPIARLRLSRGADADPLFRLVRDRRTHRVPFDPDRPVLDATIDEVAAKTGTSRRIDFTTEPARVGRLVDICLDAWSIEIGTPRTHEESVALTRIGPREVAENPDGISLTDPLYGVLGRVGVLTRDAMREKGTRAYDGSFKFYADLIRDTAAFAWLTGDGDSRRDQIKAGRDWVRLHLGATAAGLALHPLSQVLQEFPEMIDAYKAFHQEVGVAAPARVHGLFRLGYAAAPPPSPRWPLRTRLIEN